MNNFINIFEMSPRDGLQNEKNFIATTDKIKFINKLSLCGFGKIETSSFVSARWVPQLADASEVFMGIKRNENVKYTALTPNEIGLDNALKVNIDEIAVFAAASESFSKKNINCDIEGSIVRFEPVINKALKNKIPVRGYISCVAHCPYEGNVDPKIVSQIAEKLVNMGCYEVSLGDTTGKGSPDQTLKILKECLSVFNTRQISWAFS